MGALDGRVAIITGAGRGLGREHALLFAAEGAKVVVNDLGGDMHGEGGDPSAAMQTVDEIKALGGEAVVNGENVADWEGAQRMVQQAVDTFGELHVLVNNAGILRDRVIINMTEAEWDSVINVHLKGHFAPTHHAAVYWREQTKAGNEMKASIIHTTSTSGLFANPGQANYDAAKSGIATLSQVCAKELVRYGVRSNAIAPGRPHASHRGDARSRRRGEGARRRLRRVAPGQRLAVRRVPRDRRLPDHRRVLHGAGRQGAARAVVEAGGDDRQGRPLDRRGARGRGREAGPAGQVIAPELRDPARSTL